MIYEIFSQVTDDRIVASLIGMPKAKFTSLVTAFESAALALDQERVQKGEIKQMVQESQCMAGLGIFGGRQGL